MARQLSREDKTILALAALVAVCLLVAALVTLSLDLVGTSASPRDWAGPTPLEPLTTRSASNDSNAEYFSSEPWMAFTEDAEEDTETAQSAGDEASEQGIGSTTIPQESSATNPTEPGIDSDAPSTGKPAAVSVYLTGVVRHDVWGTPLSGITVRLSSGEAVLTDGTGRYLFSDIGPDQVAVVTVSGPWLSYGPLSRLIVFEDTPVHGVDFDVYAEAEASGSYWRSAASWRQESDTSIAPLIPKVAAASVRFAGLTPSSARNVLDDARNGTQQERATGELLASWLDLAASDLGFDTPVDVSTTPGGIGALGTDPDTTLGLVRQADRVIAGGDDPDWTRLRKMLSARSLTD